MPRIYLLITARILDVSPDVLLSCVAILFSEDPPSMVREAPEDVTLEALARVAWWHDLKIDFRFEPLPRSAPV